MLTLLALLSLLVAPPSLSLDKTEGPAPLHIVATVSVSGPFEGQVCVVVTEEAEMVGLLCTDNDTESVPAGVRSTFDIKMVGSQAGTYVLHPVTHTDDGTVYGEGVQVKVLEPSVQ